MGLSPGGRLGPYEILASIGAGGMGQVYRARDPRIDRDVAIKVLPESFASDPDRVTRFEREARAAGGLNHPNVITIFDVGREGSTPYLVMELLEGGTLRNVLRRGALTVEETIHRGIQIAEGLAAAHDRGITHRDLKPENILVLPDGRLKLADFGLAKQAMQAVSLEDAATEQRGTTPGTLLGTVTYMAPEQIRGAPADARSDIFALGTILHEMTSGHAPFARPSTAETMSAILRDSPPPLPPRTPRELSRIISLCLQKNPGDRFQSAHDVSLSLREIERATKSRIRRPAIGFAAAVLILIAASFLAYRFFAPDSVSPNVSPVTPPAKRPMIAVLPFENLGAPADSYFAAGMTEEITSRLTSLRELGVISRTSAAEYNRKGKTMKHIGRDLGVAYVLEGSVRWDRSRDRIRVTPQLIRVADDMSLFSEQYDRQPEQIFEVQSEIAQRVVERLGVVLFEKERAALAASPTQNLEAHQAYLQTLGIELGEGPAMREAIGALRRAVRLDPGFAAAYARLGYFHGALFHAGFDRTPARLDEAKSAIDAALKIDPHSVEATVSLAYWYYWGFRDYAKALELLERVRRERPNDPDLLHAIAAVLRRSGHFDEALRLFQEALRNDPRSREGTIELSWTYMHTRRFVEAEETSSRAIAMFPASVQSHWIRAECIWRRTGSASETRNLLVSMPEDGSEYAILALYFQNILERRYAEALQQLETSDVSLFHYTFGGEQAYIPKELMLGRSYRLLGKTAEANKSLNQARTELEKTARDLPDNPRVRSALGLAYAYLQRNADAMREGRAAMLLQPVTADALSGPQRVVDLAEIYTVVGHHDEAINALRDVLAVPSKVTPAILKLEPTWDPLRRNPRFAALVATEP